MNTHIRKVAKTAVVNLPEGNFLVKVTFGGNKQSRVINVRDLPRVSPDDKNMYRHADSLVDAAVEFKKAGGGVLRFKSNAARGQAPDTNIDNLKYATPLGRNTVLVSAKYPDGLGHDVAYDAFDLIDGHNNHYKV